MSSIIVYGKNNCPNCDRIKKVLEDNGVEFEYIKDDVKISDVARELYSKKELLETLAPLVLKDGKQIRHKDISELFRKDC